MKRNIFGKVAAFMYTIEFQKRGLPHAHFLIILTNEYKLLTPDSYDNVVCAELPDFTSKQYLRSLVRLHMMHGPCGNLDPAKSCMRKQGCEFKYPKTFADRTSKGKNSYPIYKRRNTGDFVKVRSQYLDNSWVVPYNPFLLSKFNCHINVEICSDIRAVKYIYKYICKGHDKIAFHIHNNDTDIEIDEIKEYRSARWVSPPEATWHLFGFPINEINPTVYHLQLHLKGQQFVSFKSTANVDTIVNNPMIRKTILTEFFVMNRENSDAKQLNLMYKEFPGYFVWWPQNKRWSRRKKGNVIGRVVTCHPTEGERYYLRLLLMNVRGPKSYKDLRTVNEVLYNTFREAAEKRGLLHCDNNLTECMVEAVSYQMPCSLRRLFATLLVYCNPANPKELREKFETSMSKDFKNFPKTEPKSIRYKVLDNINDILYSMGHNINDYRLIPENFKPSAAAKEAKEIYFERNITVTEEELLLEKRLNIEQRAAYNVIMDRIFSEKPGAFFIDGPGGTGKTFLYRALLATVRSKGFIALATATSGVAASILPGGRTAHSRFKIPIDIDENFSCNITKQSSLASLIRDAKLIVWDEVSMAKKKMIETFNLLLKDLLNTNVLFGGKLVVFGGDFRQTLPVVRKGRRDDFIHESLLYYDTWDRLEKLHLSENMQAKTDPALCKYLMRIGNGKEPLNSENKIEIPRSFIVPFTTEQESLDALFETTFPNFHEFFYEPTSATSRVILTTKNEFVNGINDMLISKFPKDAKTFVAIDETIDSSDQSQYEDFLHTLYPADLLAVVGNCGAMKYTANQTKRFQEAIVIDNKRKPFLFIIWEDIADNEGAELLRQLKEYPVIIAKRIAMTEFRGGMNILFLVIATTDPFHLLITLTYTVQRLSTRCQFQLEITDASGTITATVSDSLAERLLSLTAEQIYEIIAVKNESLPIQ
ncbi:uncharacterized protein LOC132041391 [Lycium ferocissimum]|uniref:uncharacterized protein LOC132041391 n=1 Tax=Lycium ferocissimum TaxID=112874 RepID=UPI00281658C9|nr:uncharacterized protein LOC132041391 [Lycium ferocissimum]